MVKNYIKIALRNLWKGRLFSLINFTGLSVGVAVVMMIMLYVNSEWSFDKFHANADQTYRLWMKEHFRGEVIFNTITPILMGEELVNNFPQVKKMARYMTTNNLVKKGNFVEEEVIHLADPDFLEIFDFPLVHGKESEALQDINQALITPQISKKYFGDEGSVGQVLTLQIGGEWRDYTISGIIENAPHNSSIKYNIILPFENVKSFTSERGRSCWTCIYVETYVQLDETIQPKNFEAQIAPFFDEKVKESYEPGQYIVGLQRLDDIHLNNAFPTGIVPVSDSRYPYILAGVALLILLLAGINFTTLAVGRSVGRAKEVGIRKVSGANKSQLMLQFWSEATLTAFISVMIAVMLVQLALPYFNTLSGKELTLQLNPMLLIALVALAILIGTLSGAYPALIVSGFSPIQSIRGRVSKIGTDKHIILRSLVGIQFVLSIGLIICTLIMQRQMHYMQNKNLGFDQEHIITFPYNVAGQRLSQMWLDGEQSAEILMNHIESRNDVTGLSTASHTLGTQGWVQLGYTERETDKFRQFYAQQIDEKYLPLMGIRLKEGRNFSKEITTDNRAVIINEAMAKAYQLEEPLGKTLPEPFQDFRIVGVVADFHFASLHTSIEPLVMATDLITMIQTAPDLNYTDFPNPKILLKLSTDNLPSTISEIRRQWKEVVPDQAFTYSFLDDNIDRQYQAEMRLSNIFSIATMLAIFIGCIGLFGITTLTISQRTKEIGVRKVLGASIPNILFLLNKEFYGMILLATLVAAPLTWYFMNSWLEDFAYRISISPWIFFMAALAALFITSLTVSYQSLRAALRNPVKALRVE